MLHESVKITYRENGQIQYFFPFSLANFLRVHQSSLHGTNIDERHLVIASPTGVLLMDFWDAADVPNATGDATSAFLKDGEDEGVAEEKGAIGGHIQKLAEFKETLIFK